MPLSPPGPPPPPGALRAVAPPTVVTASAPAPAPVAPALITQPAAAPPDVTVRDVTQAVRDAVAPAAAADVTAEQRLVLLLDEPTPQANSVTAIMGDSGSGKTTLVATGIEYCWETFHKKARVYAGDLGGFGNKMLSLIRLGIADVWKLDNHNEPFETVELASMGAWPELIRPEDRMTGYADPFVKLGMPQRRVFTAYCASGHPQPPLSDKRQLAMYQSQCPTCQTIVTLQNLDRIEEKVIRSAGFKNVGLYVYESGSALSDHALNDMADRAGRDELGGEKGALQKVVSGGMTFGSNNRAHYGFAQLRVRQWLANSRRIPGQVVPPLWTFLVDRGSDEKNSPICGPKIAGSAKTAEAASWVGNLFHAEKVRDDRTGQDKHRLWIAAHRNVAEGNVLYLAKHRAEPDTFDTPFLEDGPGEPRFTKFSLGYVFRAIDASADAALKRDGGRYPDAPALVDMDETEEEVTTNRIDPQGMAHVQAPAASVGGVPANMIPPPGAGGPVPPPGVPAGPPPPPGAPRAAAIVGVAPGPVAPAGSRPAVPVGPQQATAVVTPAAAVTMPVMAVTAPATSPVAPAPPMHARVSEAAAAAVAQVTIPTPAGPLPVPVAFLPFVSRPIPVKDAMTQAAATLAGSPGDPPVMAPASAPIRPPVPGKK